MKYLELGKCKGNTIFGSSEMIKTGILPIILSRFMKNYNLSSVKVADYLVDSDSVLTSESCSRKPHARFLNKC